MSDTEHLYVTSGGTVESLAPQHFTAPPELLPSALHFVVLSTLLGLCTREGTAEEGGVHMRGLWRLPLRPVHSMYRADGDQRWPSLMSRRAVPAGTSCVCSLLSWAGKPPPSPVAGRACVHGPPADDTARSPLTGICCVLRRMGGPLCARPAGTATWQW